MQNEAHATKLGDPSISRDTSASGGDAMHRPAASTALGRAVRTPWTAIAAITLVGVVLRMAIPAQIYWNSPHDDEGLMRLAGSILAGEWLGEWGTQPIPHITLAKGPGYSIFLAAIHWTGIGPQVIAYLIYLAGACLLASALRRHIGSIGMVALYGLLAFNPLLFTSLFSRVYRDQLVTALALLSFALAVRLGQNFARKARWSRRELIEASTETLALGIALGWLSITRSDVVWIILAAIGAIVVSLLANARQLTRRQWARNVSSALAVTAIAFAAPLTVMMLNQQNYSVRLVDDYSQGSFPDAIAAWSSVEVDGGNDFMVVDAEQRMSVYAVSNTARLMQPILENPENGWIGEACRWQQDVKTACDDFGGYFSWAVRDAAMQTGKTSTAADLQDFFATLESEIETACQSGDLTCGMPGLSPDVPALSHISSRALLAALAGNVSGSVSWRGGGDVQPVVPQDSGEIVGIWSENINGVSTVQALLDTGQHAAVVNQSNAIGLLTTAYSWLGVPMSLIAIVALFCRQMWTSQVGRLALVSLLAWIMNVGIVSLFWSATSRVQGATVSLYTMASQSFFTVGLTLSAVVVGRTIMAHIASARNQSANDHDGPDEYAAQT